MRNALHLLALLSALGTLFSLPAQASDAKSAPKSAPAEKAPASKPAPPPASPPAAPAAVQKMASDFSQQRDARLHDRRALLEKLRSAKTDEEKQRLLEQLREQQQQRLDQQREAARQAREQLRDTRK